MEPVTVQLLIASSNKYSEAHNFIYTPKSGAFGGDALMPTTLATLQQNVKNAQGILWVCIYFLR